MLGINKRYWVFAHEKYYPKGGMFDFWNSYDHPSHFYDELAQAVIDRKCYHEKDDNEVDKSQELYNSDIIQLLDTETGELSKMNLINGVPEGGN